MKSAIIGAGIVVLSIAGCQPEAEVARGAVGDLRFGDSTEGVIERDVTWDDLPAAVAETIRANLDGVEPDEIEEISIDGVPVLYEAEIERHDGDFEVVVYPDGRLANVGLDVDDDEDDDDDDEDDHGDD